MTHRNDACPCGSGKKYKRCCQPTEDRLDLQYRRQQKAEKDLVPVLLEVVDRVLVPEAIDDAWIEFNGDDDVEPFEEDDPMAMAFLPWFFYGWPFDSNDYVRDYDKIEVPTEYDDDSEEDAHDLVTIGLMHLIVFHDSLTQAQREFLAAANVATYTICEVLETKPGSGLKLRDLFCEREFDIKEHTASRMLQLGDIIYCAPMTIREVTSLLAVAPFALPPTSKLNVLSLRKSILTELKQQSLGDTELIEFEPEIRYLFLDLLESAFATLRG